MSRGPVPRSENVALPSLEGAAGRISTGLEGEVEYDGPETTRPEFGRAMVIGVEFERGNG